MASSYNKLNVSLNDSYYCVIFPENWLCSEYVFQLTLCQHGDSSESLVRCKFQSPARSAIMQRLKIATISMYWNHNTPFYVMQSITFLLNKFFRSVQHITRRNLCPRSITDNQSIIQIIQILQIIQIALSL